MYTKGINLIGFIRSETGMGQSCRAAASALDEAGIPFCILNYTNGDPSPNMDLTWSHRESNVPIYSVNIFHLNADQTAEAFRYYGESYFAGIYNIGFWHWELSVFPDQWMDAFRYLDEIWVPSRFIQQAIELKSPRPVILIPHAIHHPPDPIQLHWNREQLGLTKDCFVFLCMYSMHSYQERKNPIGAIKAFKAAFPLADSPTRLIIKVNHAADNPEELVRLKTEIAHHPNIHVLEGTMTRLQTDDLLRAVDCFVSLHRSEGFGLGLAEAMSLGRAVIGTNWSGNTDFMNADNACLVKYQLVPLTRDYGPYSSGQYWADPDIDHAADAMRRMALDREEYNRIRTAGQKTIHTFYSPQAIGQLILERLANLGIL